MHGIGIVIYIVIVFSVIFTIWGIRIHRRKYRIAYADRVVIPVVKEFFPNGEFVPFGKTCDVLNMYSYFGLFRRDMFEHVNFYMNSNDERGIETFSYDSYHNSTPTSTHSGGTCTTYEGSILKFNRPSNIKGTVKIVSCMPSSIIFKHTFADYCNLNPKATPIRMATMLPDFDNQFMCFASDKESFDAAINSNVISGLMSIKQRYGNFSVVLTSGMAMFAFEKVDAFMHLPTGRSAESADPYEATRNLIRTIIAIINDLSNAISNT